jgi:nicotinate-nucleotide adenylyltransferase
VKSAPHEIAAAPRVALLGGSFNPIHHGHLIAARSVAEHLNVDRVVLIPSATPPHKQASPELASAAHRLEMLRLAVQDEPRFEASDIEIRRTGPSYTIDTVEAFRRELGAAATIYWIIGGDTLPELHTWRRARDLVDACTIVTAVRPGYETPDLSMLQPTLTVVQVERLKANVLPTPLIDISATEIRRRIQAGRSVRYLVPEQVRAYIENRGLYRADE